MQLENLITQTVELEGLLRVLRDRKAPAVRALAEDKYRALCRGLDDFFAQTPEHPLENIAKGSISGPEPPAPPLEVCAVAEAEAEQTPEECGADDVSEAPDDVQIIIQNAVPEVTPDDAAELPAAEIEEDEVEAEPPTFRQTAAPAPGHDLSRAFTVNDRFLFIRKLFGGDAEDFAQTVKVLSAMPDLTEAKEYLFQDLMWDASEPAVEAFVGILGRCLPQRQ